MKRKIPFLPIAAAALVAIVAAAYVFAIRPKQDEVTKLDGQIATLQTTIDAANSLSKPAQGGTPNTIRVADIVQLAKAMPDQVDMPGIIFELNSAAAAAGVTFAGIQPNPPSAGTGATVVPITLTFEGTYYQLTELLFQLRNLVTVRDGVLDSHGRLFTVDSISLGPGKEGFPNVEATLTVSAYEYGVDTGALAAAGVAVAQTGATDTTSTSTTTTTPSTDTTTTAPATTTTEPGTTTTTQQPASTVDVGGSAQAQGATS